MVELEGSLEIFESNILFTPGTARLGKGRQLSGGPTARAGRGGSPASCLPSQGVLTTVSNSWIPQKSSFPVSKLTYLVVLVSTILSMCGRRQLGAICSSEIL